MLKNGEDRKCKICQTIFHVPLNKIKEGKGFYCSLECYRQSRNNPYQTSCIVCSKTFQTYPSVNQKLCSKKCHIVFQKTQPSPKKGKKFPHLEKREKRICEYCKDAFIVTISDPKRFCSHDCASKNRKGTTTNIKPALGKRGEHAFHWKGGRSKTGKYIIIFQPHHPRATKKGYVREHILVAEKVLGRFLNGAEVIHHINKNPVDNRPENLYVFSSTGEHSAYHHAHKKVHITKSNLF